MVSAEYPQVRSPLLSNYTLAWYMTCMSRMPDSM
jgi:hypothetical protein